MVSFKVSMYNDFKNTVLKIKQHVLTVNGTYIVFRSLYEQNLIWNHNFIDIVPNYQHNNSELLEENENKKQRSGKRI